MKIHYKQPKEDQAGALCRLGIRDCYLKELLLDKNQDIITRKNHYHTSFELHMIMDGFQEYEINGTTYRLDSGSFLLIYPNVAHVAVSSSMHTWKYSITFNKKTECNKDCICGKIPDRILENISFITKESVKKKEISFTLIENSILEIMVSIFRLLGIKENDTTQNETENVMITLAKQYIDDNIMSSPGVVDVATYCYLSTKQLTRIFQKYEGVTPGEYIIKRRIVKIESLLADASLSLKQVSMMMNFDNEYYFNAFFKKYSGMPPGEYRKMHGQ